jgi:hypothetical protein
MIEIFGSLYKYNKFIPTHIGNNGKVYVKISLKQLKNGSWVNAYLDRPFTLEKDINNVVKPPHFLYFLDDNPVVPINTSDRDIILAMIEEILVEEIKLDLSGFTEIQANKGS